jgi:choline dehydrogenase-like flavoprotein
MALNLLPDHYDVVIVGSGIAGALASYKLVQAGKKVCIIEAGGFAPDERDRDLMVDNFVGSPSKATDAPFCGDNVLAPQPNPRRSPDGLNADLADGANYYVYPDGYKGDKFVSYYERVVGGSTWHWQGIYVRMIPRDFEMTKFAIDNANGVADWPITYRELEKFYVEAEREMGVSGAPPDKRLYPHIEHVAPFPMDPLAPSYLDKQVSSAVRNKNLSLNAKLDNVPGMATEIIDLHVTTVPHAILSKDMDGRQACDGRTSCVPLCPTGARYEAIIHLRKARQNHNPVTLIAQAVVKNLKLDASGRRVLGVSYQKWKWFDGTKDKKYTDKGRVTDGGLVDVTADVVVLAANGIENPMILLRSEVPGAKAGAPVGAANSSSRVGKYLMDHPIKQSYALAPENLYPFRGPQTTSQIEDLRDGGFRKHYAAFKTSIKNDGWMTNGTQAPRGVTTNFSANPLYDPSPTGDWWPATILDYVANRKYAGTKLRTALRQSMRHITLNSACEQLPDENNWVALSSVNDELGIRRPLINYKVDDPARYVRNSFKKIIELHRDIFRAMGIDDKHQVLQDDKDGPLTFGGSGHIMGTTRMGSDSKNSVVKQNCQSWDHDNLFVLGSSVFPTSSSANPTSTVAALSLRTVPAILAELKKRKAPA